MVNNVCCNNCIHSINIGGGPNPQWLECRIRGYMVVDQNERCTEWKERESDVKTNARSNADKIRTMTDEELAEWIAGAECPRRNCMLADDCEACWLDWLKQEVAE